MVLAKTGSTDAPRTFILDNGGHSIKLGAASDDRPRIIPNCIVKAKSERKRVFIGEELSECLDRSALYFLLPFEKGYVVNWDVQQQVWERSFRGMDVADARLMLTDANYAVPATRDLCPEIIFELLGFGSMFKSSSAGFMGLCRRRSRACLVLDCGFSFTHVIPIFDGKIIQQGVLRMDIGGKVLTNQLKEWVTYRELNVMEETYVMSDAKEDACFVSLDFEADMQIARHRDSKNTMIREYVLPDFSAHSRGFLRERTGAAGKDGLQAITLNLERFTVPEALFSPADIGLHQMGVAECVVESTRRCPKNLRSALLSSILPIGGSTKFPNFRQRLLRDVRSIVDASIDVKLGESIPGQADGVDPVEAAWQSAKKAVGEGAIDKKCITKAQFAEHGEDLLREKFYNFLEWDDE